MEMNGNEDTFLDDDSEDTGDTEDEETMIKEETMEEKTES